MDNFLDNLFGIRGLRVIEYLVSNKTLEFNRKELAIAVNISPKTLKSILERFEKVGLITKSRKIAKSQLYMVDAWCYLFDLIDQTIQNIKELLKDEQNTEKSKDL